MIDTAFTNACERFLRQSGHTILVVAILLVGRAGFAQSGDDASPTTFGSSLPSGTGASAIAEREFVILPQNNCADAIEELANADSCEDVRRMEGEFAVARRLNMTAGTTNATIQRNLATVVAVCFDDYFVRDGYGPASGATARTALRGIVGSRAGVCRERLDGDDEFSAIARLVAAQDVSEVASEDLQVILSWLVASLQEHDGLTGRTPLVLMLSGMLANLERVASLDNAWSERAVAPLVDELATLLRPRVEDIYSRTTQEADEHFAASNAYYGASGALIQLQRRRTDDILAGWEAFGAVRFAGLYHRATAEARESFRQSQAGTAPGTHADHAILAGLSDETHESMSVLDVLLGSDTFYLEAEEEVIGRVALLRVLYPRLEMLAIADQNAHEGRVAWNSAFGVDIGDIDATLGRFRRASAVMFLARDDIDPIGLVDFTAAWRVVLEDLQQRCRVEYANNRESASPPRGCKGWEHAEALDAFSQYLEWIAIRSERGGTADLVPSEFYLKSDCSLVVNYPTYQEEGAQRGPANVDHTCAAYPAPMRVSGVNRSTSEPLTWRPVKLSPLWEVFHTDAFIFTREPDSGLADQSIGLAFQRVRRAFDETEDDLDHDGHPHYSDQRRTIEDGTLRELNTNAPGADATLAAGARWNDPRRELDAGYFRTLVEPIGERVENAARRPESDECDAIRTRYDSLAATARGAAELPRGFEDVYLEARIEEALGADAADPAADESYNAGLDALGAFLLAQQAVDEFCAGGEPDIRRPSDQLPVQQWLYDRYVEPERRPSEFYGIVGLGALSVPSVNLTARERSNAAGPGLRLALEYRHRSIRWLTLSARYSWSQLHVRGASVLRNNTVHGGVEFGNRWRLGAGIGGRLEAGFGSSSGAVGTAVESGARAHLDSGPLLGADLVWSTRRRQPGFALYGDVGADFRNDLGVNFEEVGSGGFQGRTWLLAVGASIGVSFGGREFRRNFDRVPESDNPYADLALELRGVEPTAFPTEVSD